MKTAITLLLTLVFAPLAASATPRAGSREVSPAASPTAGIQEAVDSLPAEGGVVRLATGDYALARSIVLRSGVTLQGSGGSVRLLRRDPCVEVVLLADAREGDRRIRVADASGFAVGHEVTVHSKEADGWEATHAQLVAIDGDSLVLDRGLKRDCRLADGARANNFFPGIYAREGREMVVENLALVAVLPPDHGFVQEFTVSAVHFDRVSDVRISDLHVQAWPGDGISIQGGDNATVTHCLVEACVGHGFHPGTDITSGTWSGNVARHNGEDGFYFCHNVTHTIVTGNHFHDNGRHGIGGLGAGGKRGDRHNIVEANLCWNNGRAGIEIRGGQANVVTNNVCRNNSRLQPGRWPGILLQDTARTTVAGNQCVDDREGGDRTQGWGLLVKGNCADNQINGNLSFGNLNGDSHEVAGP